MLGMTYRVSSYEMQAEPGSIFCLKDYYGAIMLLF